MERTWALPKLPPHRTIRILVPKERWELALNNCQYERYGMVRVCRYDIIDDHLQCLVEFEDKGVVEEIVSDGFIYLNDERIKVDLMATLQSNPATTTNNCQLIGHNDDDDRRPWQNGSEFNLNDDCIRFIFRKLHIPTLWSLANVCVRFETLANETFRLKYKNHEIRFSDIGTNYPISLRQIEEFLRKFGTSIRNLQIDPEEFDHFKEYELNDVLLQINNNCPDIKSLNMWNLEATGDIKTKEFLPLFSRLEKLSIQLSGDTDYSAILQAKTLTKLTALSIDTQKLEHLESCFSSQNNWQLEDLRVIFDPPKHIIQTMPHSSHVLRMICERNCNVRNLQLWFMVSDDDVDFATNLLQISQLRGLQTLQFNFNSRSVRPLLDAIRESDIQLKYLGLVNGSVESADVDIISQMKSLRTIQFLLYTFDVADLVPCVSQLPELSELHVYLPLVNHFFDVIASIILNGKTLSTLVVYVTCSEIARYANKKYKKLLSIVKRRVDPPTKLEVTINNLNCPKWPKDVAHYVKIALRPELLTLKIQFGDNLQ